MADKPARALVIYGDGLMPLVSPAHTHIHKLASLGSCGFLALREAPNGENEDARVLRELCQLFDMPYSYNSGEHLPADVSTIENICIPKLSERFMGMRALLCTGCPPAKSFGRDIGFPVANIDDLMKENVTSEESDQTNSSVIASELLKWLGFQDGKVTETSEYDLVFLHVKSSTEKLEKQTTSDGGDLELLNVLVGDILQIAQSAPQISSRLHLSLILSYGSISEIENRCSLVTNLMEESNDLAKLYPKQCYTMKEGNTLNDIRNHHPMLIAQWQDAIIRRDRTQAFEFEEFQKVPNDYKGNRSILSFWNGQTGPSSLNGGSLSILAERFIYEIAFKLWKAPKYGA